MSTWFIGAYGADMDGSAPGVTAMRSRENGSLEVDESLSIPLASPSFLAATRTTLYATLEGSAQIAAIDLGSHEVLGTPDTGGRWPCHIGVYGDTVVVANYADGSLGVLAAEPFALTTTLAPEPGSGPHPPQEGPHAHASVELVPGVIVSADLGADRLHVHTLADGVLTRIDSVELPAGTGPRDLLVHPSGMLLVLAEHGRSVLALDWRSDRLHFVDSVALPGAEEGDQAAGLVLSHDGFAYALLRGSNRVSVLRVGEDGRELERVGSVSSEGDWPRHLAVDGRVLHVANQLSGSIASFALGDDGIPALIAPPTAVASPTYLLER